MKFLTGDQKKMSENKLEQENMQLKAEIMQIKSKMCDVMLKADDQKDQMIAEIQNWQAIGKNISNLLGLDNPSLEQMYAKIKGMRNIIKKSQEKRTGGPALVKNTEKKDG